MIGSLQLEAERFETRTMPTPDMKSKEMIYWIKVRTKDERLIRELNSFLEGSERQIDLRVPSAFIWVKTELESIRPELRKNDAPPSSRGVSGSRTPHGRRLQGVRRDVDLDSNLKERGEEYFDLEIVLRRLIPESQKGQLPYG